MCGPMMLAIASGIFFHSLMNSWYFGFSGLLSGTWADSYRRYS
jgi:hypothetical protein